MKVRFTLTTVCVAGIEVVQNDLNQMRFLPAISAEEILGKGQIEAEVSRRGGKEIVTYIQIDPEV